MTRDEFKILAKGMKAVYTQPTFLPDADAFNVWYSLLQDLDYMVAQAAIQKYMLTNKFQPTIADIRTLAAEITNGDIPDWGSGWQQVCDAMKKYGREYPKSAYKSMHPIVAEAAQQMGAWWDLCTSNNIDTDRANFRMIYEQIVNRENTAKQLPVRLSNLIEQVRESGKLLEGGE